MMANLLSSSRILFDQTDLQHECEVLNAENWRLISFFFGRCLIIVITVMMHADTNEMKCNFATSFIRDLMDNTGIPVAVIERDIHRESETIGNSDRYNWQGELFETSTGGEVHVRETRRDAQLFGASPRKDESQRGIVVIVKNITVLDNYLIGPARSPFRTAINNYIIVVHMVADGWREQVEIVLRRMWNYYGIANALLMAPCADSGSEVFATYHPYEVDPSIVDPVVEDYGSVRWHNIHDFEHSNELLTKLERMNGFPYRVSIFERYPTALLPQDLSPIPSYFNRAIRFSGGFGGFDGLVLGNMAQRLKFRPILVNPNVSDFGHVGRNGSYFGSLGDVLYRRAYISMNGRFVADYGTSEVDFLYPVNFDRFCIIAPKSLQIPTWMAIFRCFPAQLWIAMLAMNVACGLVWWMLRKFGNRQNAQNQIRNCVVCVSLEMFLIMLSAPSIYMPKRTMERVFMATCLFGTLICIGFFQGTLYTSYSTPSFYKDINTLAELDASGLAIGTTSASLIDIFGFGDSPLLHSLISKFSLFGSERAIIDRTAYERDICCIERCSDIEVIVAKRYELSDGNVLLHAIPESPKYCHIAYIVKKGWPWMSAFNEIIHRFHEAGLLTKWYSETQDSIILHERIARRNHVAPIRGLTMVDLQTAFYILGIGQAFCSFVFFVETILVQRLQHHTVYTDDIAMFPYID